MAKRGLSMTPEQCAERMTRFLARKPSSGKTRAYLGTLPKRAAIVVSPSEYVVPEVPAEERVKRILAKFPPLPKSKPPVFIEYKRESPELVARKDRTRPGKDVRLLIERMVDAQMGRCILCGTKIFLDVDLPSHAPQRGSFDHVLPRSRGGANLGNRIAAHRRCNEDKGNRLPTGCELVWLAVVNAAIGYTPPLLTPET